MNRKKKELDIFDVVISKRGTVYMVIAKEGKIDGPKGITYILINMLTRETTKHARNKILAIKSDDIDCEWWKMIIDANNRINNYSNYGGLSVRNQVILSAYNAIKLIMALNGDKYVKALCEATNEVLMSRLLCLNIDVGPDVQIGVAAAYHSLYNFYHNLT